MKLLEDKYIWFIRIVWSMIYLGLAFCINFDNVYATSGIIVTIVAAFGAYFVSKILVMIVSIAIAVLCGLPVDINIHYAFTINDKTVL